MQHMIDLHIALYKVQGLRCDQAISKATEQSMQAYHDLNSYERKRYIVQLKNKIAQARV